MIEDDLEKILSDLKNLYKKRKEVDVSSIDEERAGEVAAVDGGSSILWSNGVKNIGIIRYDFVVYEGSTIKEYFVENTAVLTEDIDSLRTTYEMQMVKKAAQQCSFVLYDGALITSYKEVKETIQDLQSTIVGISKKTKVSLLEEGIPDTMVIKNPGRWYYNIDVKLTKYRWHLIGDVYVARLHEKGRTFRVDTVHGGEEVFPRLAYFSTNPLCFGYPYPLLEAHRLVCLDDKKEAFKTILRRIMVEKGLKDAYFSGVIENDKMLSDFHRSIDNII
jgi:hypothetical protein